MKTSDGDAGTLPPNVARSVDDCLAELDGQHFARRIHEGDVALWQGNTIETAQRLGWLHVCRTMVPEKGTIDAFSEQVRHDGITDVVLLGMGGSSLGAEVLNQVFGRKAGCPRLHVLDSTVPSAIASVERRITYPHTLFVVSSKSGGTLEPNVLCEYFYDRVRANTGQEAGSHFIAITDGGSSLERKARESAFRHTFLNPSDIGGRYSVLSLFGLVPASLLGIDISRLLASAAQMAASCGPDTSSRANPGTHLGAYIAGCARLGRNKLTLLTSPVLRSFGLWVEQLVAESTGKEGKGVVPVVDEPELELAAYPGDRAFVYLRLEGDQNGHTDSLARRLNRAGLPCLTIAGTDSYSLGSEFFRWEYATAVVGALLGVNPFDQPDVQRAKEASIRVLEQFIARGALPQAEAALTLPALLGTLRQGDYLGIMAYLEQRPEIDGVFSRFRHRVGSHHHVSTTLGYGPRFLHSTGQLHKGGPDECALLQIVGAHPNDLAVPGTNYTFGTVADAQALGDLQALLSINRRVSRIATYRRHPVQPGACPPVEVNAWVVPLRPAVCPAGRRECKNAATVPAREQQAASSWLRGRGWRTPRCPRRPYPPPAALLPRDSLP